MKKKTQKSAEDIFKIFEHNKFILNRNIDIFSRQFDGRTDKSVYIHTCIYFTQRLF